MFNNEHDGEKKLDWMYKGATSQLDREEYLLGRSVDKSFEQLNAEEKEKQQGKNHVEHECIPPSIRDYKLQQALAEQVDLQAKLQEDPLLTIKKREEETRRQFLQNPVQLKKLQKALSKQEKKSKKKKKKDVDEQLIEKLKMLQNHSLGMDLPIKTIEKHDKKALREKDLDIILMHKFNSLKSYLTEDDLKDIMDGKFTDSDSSSTDDEDAASDSFMKHKKKKDNKKVVVAKKKKKNNKKHSMKKSKKTQKKNKKRKQESSSSSSSSSDSSDESSSSDEDSTPKKKSVHKKKRKSSSSSDSESEDDKNKKKRKKRSRHESTSESEDKYKMNSKTSSSKKKYVKEKKHKDAHQRSRSKAEDKHTNRRRDSNSQTHESRNRHSSRERRNSDRQRTPSRDTLDKYRNPDNRERNRSRSRSNSRRKLGPERPPPEYSRRRDDSDEDHTPKIQNWGLVKSDGTQIPLSRRSRTPERHRKKDNNKVKSKEEDTTSKSKSSVHKPSRLTAEEKEKKLREMMQNGEERDLERARNIRKYREDEAKEEKNMEYNPEFAHKVLSKSANAYTVESRIKANLNNIQRKKSDMNTHFSKRH